MNYTTFIDLMLANRKIYRNSTYSKNIMMCTLTNSLGFGVGCLGLGTTAGAFISMLVYDRSSWIIPTTGCIMSIIGLLWANKLSSENIHLMNEMIMLKIQIQLPELYKTILTNDRENIRLEIDNNSSHLIEIINSC